MAACFIMVHESSFDMAPVVTVWILPGTWTIVHMHRNDSYQSSFYLNREISMNLCSPLIMLSKNLCSTVTGVNMKFICTWLCILKLRKTWPLKLSKRSLCNWSRVSAGYQMTKYMHLESHRSAILFYQIVIRLPIAYFAYAGNALLNTHNIFRFTM